MDKIQEEIIGEFSVFDDWLDKYDYLIGLSDSLPAIAAEHRTEQYLIDGCQSRVWVDARLEDGKVYYAADSDAIITKGIIALLIRVLNGRTPQEILDTDLYFIDAIGLSANLSPTRSNGLLSMVKQMRLYALAFASKSEKYQTAMTPEDILKVEKDIVLTLKNIYDPEIPVNIYDLGLIYEIDYTPDGVANIRMTLTAPNCPMADMLVEDVNQQVAKVDGVKAVNVILTFDPVWDKSMMSEEALLELNMF